MALQTHVAPRNPDELVEIAERELENLNGAYKGGLSNDLRIEIALRAAEAALKAIIWRFHRWTQWPTRKENKVVYKHNLGRMLNYAGARVKLQASPKHWASWKTVLNAAARQLRYAPNAALPSDKEMHEVSRAARHPETGVVRWLLKYYREMP